MRSFFKLTPMEKTQREVGFHNGLTVGLICGVFLGMTVAGWLGTIGAICHF